MSSSNVFRLLTTRCLDLFDLDLYVTGCPCVGSIYFRRWAMQACHPYKIRKKKFLKVKVNPVLETTCISIYLSSTLENDTTFSILRPFGTPKSFCSFMAFIVTTHEDANKQGHGNLKVCKTATHAARHPFFFSRGTVTVGAEP